MCHWIGPKTTEHAKSTLLSLRRICVSVLITLQVNKPTFERFNREPWALACIYIHWVSGWMHGKIRRDSFQSGKLVISSSKWKESNFNEHNILLFMKLFHSRLQPQKRLCSQLGWSTPDKANIQCATVCAREVILNIASDCLLFFTAVSFLYIMQNDYKTFIYLFHINCKQYSIRAGPSRAEQRALLLNTWIGFVAFLWMVL
jgi:hypothetical protein